MARKIKLNMYDIYDLGLVWFGSERVKYTINNKVVYGTRYLLDKPINEKQLEFINNFKNVLLGNAIYKYANEIKYQTITLMDKTI